MVRVEPLMHLELTVGPPLDVGLVDGIGRRLIPILGGKVTGNYSGMVLPGGADWQLVRSDGTLEIEARYILELSNERVEVDSRGIRHGPPGVLERLALGVPVDPTSYYFRTVIRFATASAALSDLNHMLALARGERHRDKVLLAVHEVE